MPKVLLVEDDTNLSEIYQARLEAEGYEVVAAPDGETALALAAKEKPDLIISDVMMPKISGFEMLDILRNTDGLKHTKVIMLTALGQAEDKTRAEQLGADRYLVKSQVTLEDIVTAAQALLNQDDDLPTSSQLAQPAMTASDTAGSDAVTPPATEPVATPAPVVQPVAQPAAQIAVEPVADPVTMPVAAEPEQPAPTGPLEATEPVITPVSTDPSTVTATPDPAIAEPAAEAAPEAPSAPAPLIEVLSPDETVNQPAGLAEQAEPQAAATAEQAQTAAQEAATVEEKIAGFATETPETPATPTPAPAADTPAVDPAAAPVPQPAPDPVPTPEPAAQTTDTTAVATPVEEPAVTSEPATYPQPTPALTASTPETAAPAQPSAPASAPTAAAIDEKVVANAIDKLLAKSPNAPADASRSDTHTSNAALSPNGPAERPHKKIISPIARPKELTLQELLAKEEAINGGSVTQPAGVPASPPTAAPAAATAATGHDAEAEAMDALNKARAANAGKAEEKPEDKDSFDPNSIAL